MIWSTGLKFFYSFYFGPFKRNNHQTTFRHERYRHETTLSSHIWRLKEEGRAFGIEWSIQEKAKAYHPDLARCQLCNSEKTRIVMADQSNTLNFRNDTATGSCSATRRKTPQTTSSWIDNKTGLSQGHLIQRTSRIPAKLAAASKTVFFFFFSNFVIINSHCNFNFNFVLLPLQIPNIF